MKKFLTILFLLLVIIISFGFVFLRLEAQGGNNNYFNTHWRTVFARHELMRAMLGLHFDGDARADYLGKSYGNIVVEVDSMENSGLDNDSLDQLSQKISKATGKIVTLDVSDQDIPYQASVTEQDIGKLVKQYRNHKKDEFGASFYVLILSQEEGSPKLLGLTHEEYGAVLFSDAIKNFSSNRLLITKAYEVSTLLHEFGHQLGLSHNQEKDCLMTEHAEQDHTAKDDTTEIVSDFCEMEKQQIVNMNY